VNRNLTGIRFGTLRKLARVCEELLYLFVLVFLCTIARFWPKRIDVGLGPEPMINNVYHKQALVSHGFSAETFVTSLYFITENFDRRLVFQSRVVRRLLISLLHLDFLLVIFRYRCLYIYFNGGPLQATLVLWRFEPALLALARVKTVVMPYGGDVQELTRCPTLLFRHVMALDYPLHRFRKRRIAAKIDLWTTSADHVIAGCDWVDYMYFWDTLMVAHFSIDTEAWKPAPPLAPTGGRRLRVLHAPNHRNIKGTGHFIRAVEELKAEGCDVELVLLEKVPNEYVKEAIRNCDVVADQLIIGWYAMFAIEAMAMGKPVLCFVRQDLRDLYQAAGLLGPDDPPLVNCSIDTLKDTIRCLAADRSQVAHIGKRSREYVERVHSTQAVGAVFAKINEAIGLEPSMQRGI
jgi:glycosyltransferase involved in cell wall biosynthesis